MTLILNFACGEHAVVDFFLFFFPQKICKIQCLHRHIHCQLTTSVVVKDFIFKGLCGLQALWFFVRIGPIRFLAGCRKRRLNQG